MKYKYTLTQIVSDYVNTQSGYETVKVRNKFEVEDYDSLLTVISSLVEFGPTTICLEIERKINEEVGLNE